MTPMSMLLTLLLQSLVIRGEPLPEHMPEPMPEPMPTFINDQQTNEPEFYGQILTEPLKPRIGDDVTLSCPIKNLGKFKIVWYFVDNQQLLVVQNYVITNNSRIGIKKVKKGEISYWGLIIKNVSLDDSGYYVCKILSDKSQSLLKFLNIFVPIEFINNESFGSDSVITVRESENVSLSCKATGNPKPTIIWRKQDGRIILDSRLNKIQDFVESEALNLQEVSRFATGDYICIASNDIDNSIRRKVKIQVHFSPTIIVPNKVVNAFVNQNTSLECITESNPLAQHFWRDISGNIIDFKKSKKYKIKTIPTNSYKVHFKLTIIDIDLKDSGKYDCISSNQLGVTTSTISLIVKEFSIQTTTTLSVIKTFTTNQMNESFEEYSPESHLDYNEEDQGQIKVDSQSNDIIPVKPLYHLFSLIISFLIYSIFL